MTVFLELIGSCRFHLLFRTNQRILVLGSRRRSAGFTNALRCLSVALLFLRQLLPHWSFSARSRGSGGLDEHVVGTLHYFVRAAAFLNYGEDVLARIIPWIRHRLCLFFSLFSKCTATFDKLPWHGFKALLNEVFWITNVILQERSKILLAEDTIDSRHWSILCDRR